MAKTKPMRDLVKGDKIRVEYKEPGKWKTVEVDHIERHSGYDDCLVVGTCDGEPFRGWGVSAHDVDIVESEDMKE